MNLSGAPLWVSAGLGLIAVIALVAIVFWVVRRMSRGLNFSDGAQRGKRSRLGVIDAFDIDRQRRLILLRRDNVEHLVMIGGPNDLLIEPTIRRGVAQAARGQAATAQPAPAALPAAMQPREVPQPVGPRAGKARRPVDATPSHRRRVPPEPVPAPQPANVAQRMSASPSASPAASPRGETQTATRPDADRARRPEPPNPAPSAPAVTPSGRSRLPDADLAAMAHKLEEALRRPAAGTAAPGRGPIPPAPEPSAQKPVPAATKPAQTPPPAPMPAAMAMPTALSMPMGNRPARPAEAQPKPPAPGSSPRPPEPPSTGWRVRLEARRRRAGAKPLRRRRPESRTSRRRVRRPPLNRQAFRRTTRPISIPSRPRWPSCSDGRRCRAKRILIPAPPDPGLSANPRRSSSGGVPRRSLHADASWRRNAAWLSQAVHALVGREFQHRLPQMVAIDEGPEGFDARERQGLDDRIDARLVEERDREARPARAQHPVLRRLDPPACPALEKAAEIDRDRSLARRHVDPLARRRQALAALRPRPGRARSRSPKSTCAPPMTRRVEPSCSTKIAPSPISAGSRSG